MCKCNLSSFLFFQWCISQQVSFFIFPRGGGGRSRICTGVLLFIMWPCKLSVTLYFLWISPQDFFFSRLLKTNSEDAVCRNDLNQISQIPQFEDVKFEAASLLSELYCQQVSAIYIYIYTTHWCIVISQNITQVFICWVFTDGPLSQVTTLPI